MPRGMVKETYVAISGGADPFHCGHLDLIEDAARYGKVIFILNSDDWLQRKKGYKFMPWNKRARILKALKDVDSVIAVDDSDGTVCKALLELMPDYFANGGDRKPGNTPEVELCEKLGIQLLWNIGGEKTDSSSSLVFEAWNNYG